MPTTPRIFMLLALLGLGGVFTLLTGCSTHTTGTYDNPNKLFREIGYEDAVQLSESQKKPMLLFFSENWVRDREKLLARTLTSLETIQLLQDRTIDLQIDRTDLPDVSKKYRVTSAPVLLLVGADGKELRRWKSLPRAEPFNKEITFILDAAEKSRHIAAAENSPTEP